jgi:hypothetical protein
MGVASVCLALGSVLPSPIGFICAALSCVVGFLAAQQGSKWWLVVPCTIVVMFGLLAYVGFHAR